MAVSIDACWAKKHPVELTKIGLFYRIELYRFHFASFQVSRLGGGGR